MQTMILLNTWTHARVGHCGYSLIDCQVWQQDAGFFIKGITIVLLRLFGACVCMCVSMCVWVCVLFLGRPCMPESKFGPDVQWCTCPGHIMPTLGFPFLMGLRSAEKRMLHLEAFFVSVFWKAYLEPMLPFCYCRYPYAPRRGNLLGAWSSSNITAPIHSIHRLPFSPHAIFFTSIALHYSASTPLFKAPTSPLGLAASRCVRGNSSSQNLSPPPVSTAYRVDVLRYRCVSW